MAMEITGAYTNYLNISNLLAPLGVSGSANYVTQVFSSSVAELQDKIDQQIFSRESSVALSELYGQVTNLSLLADRLAVTDTNSVFNNRTAQSSDSGVLTATAWDSFSPGTGAAEATYDISVSQLARGQENTGTALAGSDQSAVEAGVNVFTITVEEQDYVLDITVAADDTNGDILYEISRVINERVSGLSAEMTDDEGTVSLNLTSDATGAEAAFTVSDISGNAVAATGIDNVSVEAADAVYSVDGASLVSEANSVYLDDGAVQVNLYGTGDATLEVGPDETAVYNAVTSMANGINSYIDFYNDNSDYLSEDLLTSLNSVLNDQKSDLASIGITLNSEGYLQIDESTLTSAVNNNPSAVENIFSSFDGFAQEISSYTSGIASESPLSYAKEAETLSGQFIDFIYNSSAMRLQNLLSGSLLSVYV